MNNPFNAPPQPTPSHFAQWRHPRWQGFFDPFDVKNDITLDNPKYRVLGLSLMTGKLDWVLVRGVRVAACAIGNHDFSASDHKWLQVTVW